MSGATLTLQAQCSPGTGSTKGRLHILVAGRHAALHWQAAEWLGNALRRPYEYAAQCPFPPHVLRVVLLSRGEQFDCVTVRVELGGKPWFEAPTDVATVVDGRRTTSNPAEALGAYIREHAKRVEELERVGEVIDSQAHLLHAGIPQAITHDRRIFDEAAKAAQFDHEFRSTGRGRVSALSGRAIMGLPTAVQHAPNATPLEVELERIERMSPDALARYGRRIEKEIAR